MLQAACPANAKLPESRCKFLVGSVVVGNQHALIVRQNRWPTTNYASEMPGSINLSATPIVIIGLELASAILCAFKSDTI
jgi:hypothetical protein